MRKTRTMFVCVALLALALLVALITVKTGPEATREPPPKIAPLVETQTLARSDEMVVLHLTGTVVPAQEVMLRARVSGEVVSMAPEFIEGGMLAKDEQVLQIDPVDYELGRAEAESSLETARFNYKLEQGHQDVARREWALLSPADASEMERELALRIPHLAASKASLKAAEATLQKAGLDLARTDLRAPFNAVVLSRNVNVGSQAAPQDVLAELAGTDTCWVEVAIPVDRTGWVAVPGATVSVISSSGAVREGRVIKMLANLEAHGRMARLLVEVSDPLCLRPENAAKRPLLLGEYVRAAIEGRTLAGVYRIPREAFHANDEIWLASEGKLDIRKVGVLWRSVDQVLVRDGLSDGELLIVSDLTIPINGMDVDPKGGRNK